MRTQQRNWLGGKLSLAGILKLGLAALLGFTGVNAFAQQVNDNFDSAITITINGSGSTNGSNIGATSEPGEPIVADNGGGKTIWYKWTARQGETVQLTTEGSDFDTVLGVYTGSDVATLTLVAQNDDVAFPNDLTSQLSFAAYSNTVYYIAVDGREGDSGNVILNWTVTGAYSAGQFTFANPGGTTVTLGSGKNATRVPLYIVTEEDGSVRARLVRTNGYAGKVIVGYSITNFTWIDTFVTNIYGTNVLISNSDGTFTNTFSTNVYSINTISNFYGGVFTQCVYVGGFSINSTNATGLGNSAPVISQGTVFSPGCAPGVCTNFPTVTTTNTTNSSGVVITTTTTTNIFCCWTTNTVSTPSATPGVDYNPGSGVPVTMNDFIMAADINFGVIANRSAYNNPNVDPRLLRNHIVVISLSTPQFASNESTNLAPPTLSVSNALVEIENLNVTQQNPCQQANQIVNFVTSVNRTFEPGAGQTTYSVGVELTGVNLSAGCSVDFAADYLPPANANNRFNLQPGSDYATPAGGFPGSSKPAHFSVNSGTLTWVANDPNRVKTISVTIFHDPSVQFNEDLQLQLLNPVNCVLGQQFTSTVTIQSTDEPAGGLDANFNPANSSGTVPPFNQQPGAGGSADTVYTLVMQPDNKIVIGGNFVAYNTALRNHIARVNANGSLDTAFMASPNSGANGNVTSLALQPDGRIIVGGLFTAFNATNRFHIARLNTDGSLDLSFNPGFGANGTVWATAVQPDGRILIGGDFTTVNTTNCYRIARLNADGSLDNTFNPGSGFNGIVNALAIQADGKVLVGGQFTALNGTTANYIARLNTDGTPDTTFNTGFGADHPVYSLTEQSDGKVIVGGAFATINITPRNGIARLNADGSVDLNFDPGSGASDVVYTTCLDANTNIMVGGLFTSINGTRRLSVARLFPDGTVDTSFMDTAYNQLAGLYNDFYNKAYQPVNPLFAIGLQSDGGVIIGGHFTQVGGGSSRVASGKRMNLARLLGGSTPGPGSIGFEYGNYSVDMPDIYTGANTLYVSLVRTNGYLGPASAILQPNPLHQGLGSAIPNVDYIQNVQTVTWRNSTWPFQSWMYSDDVFGPNYQTRDWAGNGGGAISSFVTVLSDVSSIGNLGLNLQLTQPPGATGGLMLGNEPIPTFVALSKATAPMTIVDDSVPAGVLAFSTQQFYVNESATNAVITVIRTNGSSGPVSVQYFTQPGSALPGPTNNYIAVSGTLTFGSGETNKSFTIPIVDNFVVNYYDNSLMVVLTNVTGGATIADPNTSTLTIINDNFTPGILSFSNSVYTVQQNDGYAILSVIRQGGSAGIEKVSYFTMDGSATSNVDYVATNGVLTWNNGDTAPKFIKVPVLNTGVVNSNVMMSVVLTNVIVINNGNTTTNNPFALQAPTSATLTIINDNAYGSPTLSASSYNVNENGGGAVITVNRLGGSSQTITVDYATADDSAFGGYDYTPVSGTLTFTNGQISQSFYVWVTDNSGNETAGLDFFVNLSNPTPASGPTGGVSLGNITTAPVNIIANEVQDQPPGAPDKTFSANAGFNANVYALALQGDGSIIAGGDFTAANGIARNRIARLNGNGNLDVKFSSATDGANASVRALAIQSDGQILVGGLFNTFNGVNQNYFTRLNYDGTLDSSFSTGSGADNPVYGIAETFVGGIDAAHRKIVIGGSFASVGGIPYRSIAQLNQDGSVDTTFNAIGANGTVYAVAVYSTNDAVNGGKIVIGGDFTTVNGTNVNHVARLNADGTLDLSFNNILSSSGPDDSVRSVAIQVDGKVVIGGLFASVNGTPQNYVARLNTDGTLDTSFSVGPGANDAVSAVTIQQDLKVVLGGSFTQASGVTRNRLTRLKADGTVDAGINFGQGANDFVDAIVVQPDGKLVIAGNFTQFNGESKPHIARLFGGTVTGEGLVQFTSALYQVNENGTNVVITVERVGGTGENGPGSYNGPVNVNFSTSLHTAPDGLTPATDGVDYIGVTNLTLTFQPGETFQSVTIPVLNDPTNMGELYVDLALAQPGDQTTDATLGNQPTAELGIIGANSTMSFSAANFSVNKNASSGTALITVQRNDSSIGIASVDFYTTNTGTATPGQDYTPVTNTLVFADGQASQTILIPIVNNGLPEGNLTIGLALANPTNTVLDTNLPTTAVLTIVDNSLAPGNLGFSAATYTVAQTGTNAVITLIRTNGSVGQVSVNFSASGGTATNGKDYVATNGTVNFVDGQLSKTFSVSVLNNTNLTSDVTVNLTLSQPTGGANLTGPVTVPLTIQNENLDVSFAQTNYFVDEKNGTVSIGINRLGNTNTTLSVNFATANGTALAGTNYVTTSGVLTFLPGQTFETISVPILYDSQVTGDLVFLARLSVTNGSPVHIVTPSTATITVLDDDSGFAFASATNSVVKSFTNAVIQVVRYGSTAGSVTVNYTASAGTAAPNVEFVPTNGVLTFTSGMATNFFTVPILNDNLLDGDRTVILALSMPTNGTSLLSPSNTTLTIVDNESGLSLSSAAYTVQENGRYATITVLRTGVTSNTVSVNYFTSDITAHAPFDYTNTSGTLVFTNGQTSRTFQVPINDNNVTGGSETFLVQLTAPSSTATLTSPSAAPVTILNNDGSLIVAAGSAVTTPASGVVYPGTSTTVLLSLRNSAGMTATNVTATLLPTNGITPTGTTTQNYGNLDVNGASAFRPFTFTASGTNGGSVSAVLSVHYGTNASIVSFSYVLGAVTNYFYNTNVINILDVSAANPYPSTINVGPLGGVISKVTATVSNLTHTYVSDVSMLVVGPDGHKELLMEQTGGKHAIANVTLTFDSTSGNVLTTNAPVSGTYAPSPLKTTNTFHTSTNGITPPQLPYNQNLSDFVGANPNGTWSLYVDDFKALDTGTINNGWSLAISTLNVVLPNNDLVVGLAANSSQVSVSNNLTYTITVTNAGPSPATGVTLSDVLPVGAKLLSVNPSQGTYSTNATGVTCNLGTLSTNGTASVTITVVPTVVGSIMNSVSVAGNEIEDNVLNNTASLTTSVTTPTADLALSTSVTPSQTLVGNTFTFTINVANFGPGTATGVYVTNSVPAGLTLVSDTAGSYTNASGFLTSALGNLGSGASQSFTITMKATGVGAATTTFGVGSTVPDPLMGNNFCSLQTVGLSMPLNSKVSAHALTFTWANSPTSYRLLSSTNLKSTNWVVVTNAITLVNGSNTVTVPVSTGNKFFRLVSP